MATSNNQKTQHNSRAFSVVWLDADVDQILRNKHTQHQLYSIFRDLKMFHNLHNCEDFIQSLTIDDRIILIVSDQLGRELVPRIHSLRQISAIYVFCRQESTHEEWFRFYSKVKNIFLNFNDLLEELLEDSKCEEQMKESMPMHFYHASANNDKSITELNGGLIHFLLLIDALTRTKPNQDDKKKLIDLFIEEYKHDEFQLRLIQEFDEDYNVNDILWWYTRDAFLYKTLNRALRSQNIELLLLFHFVIQDIYQLLKKHQCRTPVHVYRYQPVSTAELRSLHDSVGQFMSIKSFFSTRTNRFEVLQFSNRPFLSNDINHVLFSIDADPRVIQSKPFADITSLSYIRNKPEILFMIGTIFRIKSVHWDEEANLWEIAMELTGEDDHELQPLFNHVIKASYYNGNETDLETFANILQLMGKFDVAEKIVTNLHTSYSSDNLALTNLSYSLGMFYKDKKNYDLSLQWFHNALKKKIHADSSDNIYIGGLHVCIGNIHMEREDFTEALYSYQNALNSFRVANAFDHPIMASLYHGLARIYSGQTQYTEALKFFEESLSVQYQYLPSDHPDIALNISGLGDVYEKMGDLERALNCHNDALNMRKKSLPEGHQDIGSSHRSIGRSYEEMKRLHNAADCYNKAAAIYRRSLSPHHPNVIEIAQDIKRIREKLN